MLGAPSPVLCDRAIEPVGHLEGAPAHAPATVRTVPEIGPLLWARSRVRTPVHAPDRIVPLAAAVPTIAAVVVVEHHRIAHSLEEVTHAGGQRERPIAPVVPAALAPLQATLRQIGRHRAGGELDHAPGDR